MHATLDLQLIKYFAQKAPAGIFSEFFYILFFFKYFVKELPEYARRGLLDEYVISCESKVACKFSKKLIAEGFKSRFDTVER